MRFLVAWRSEHRRPFSAQAAIHSAAGPLRLTRMAHTPTQRLRPQAVKSPFRQVLFLAVNVCLSSEAVTAREQRRTATKAVPLVMAWVPASFYNTRTTRVAVGARQKLHSEGNVQKVAAHNSRGTGVTRT